MEAPLCDSVDRQYNTDYPGLLQAQLPHLSRVTHQTCCGTDGDNWLLGPTAEEDLKFKG
jgi:hypothetical protein